MMFLTECISYYLLTVFYLIILIELIDWYTQPFSYAGKELRKAASSLNQNKLGLPHRRFCLLGVDILP